MRYVALALPLLLFACTPAAQAPTDTPAWAPEVLRQLRTVAADATAEGLPSEQAALDELQRFETAAPLDSVAAQQVDVAADALFASLARSFAQGATDPDRADAAWTIEPPPPPDIAALHAAREEGADVRTLLRALLPQSNEYAALREELARTVEEPSGATNASGLDRDTRMVRLRVNLERWRWLPREMPASRVEVRLPQAEVLLYRGSAAATRHIAIVGARQSPTPTFAAEISSITLNPSWTPPAQIVRDELLPQFRRNPAAAARGGFDAVDATGAVVDPARVDWSSRPFPYSLRQRPGPSNALGRLRFDLPNPFAIYLHDTPNRALFAQQQRLFSHGCIRVDDPVGLAEAVLQDPNWTRDSLESAMDTGVSQAITVPSPMPVFVLYLTATRDDQGAIVFHDDVYDRDQAVVAQLDAPDVGLVARPSQAARCPA
jgi:L,D-transpeptidase YcbB